MSERSRAPWRTTQDGRRDTAYTPPEWERFAEQLAAPLRAPVRTDPALPERVMQAVREDARRMAARQSAWWRRPLTVRVTPLRALAIAAGMAAVYAGAGLVTTATRRAPAPPAVASSRDTVHVIRFVLVAPGASSVAVVGDFNRWDLTAHPLGRSAAGNVWSTSIQLPPGRHEYVFVIDGKRWVADPAAAPGVADEFGGQSSTITVGRPDSPRAS